MNIQRGTLYLADLDPRQGTEPGKVRPVLVIQSDLLNAQEHPSTWILPCTTRLVGENILRVSIPKGMAGNRANCEIMIDQSRTVDNRRLKKQLEPLPKTILREVEEKLRALGDL